MALFIAWLMRVCMYSMLLYVYIHYPHLFCMHSRSVHCSVLPLGLHTPPSFIPLIPFNAVCRIQWGLREINRHRSGVDTDTLVSNIPQNIPHVANVPYVICAHVRNKINFFNMFKKNLNVIVWGAAHKRGYQILAQSFEIVPSDI